MAHNKKLFYLLRSIKAKKERVTVYAVQYGTRSIVCKFNGENFYIPLNDWQGDSPTPIENFGEIATRYATWKCEFQVELGCQLTCVF